ncbi:alkaline phosphatase [Novimethylophilus kurashikiensis]|uniref:Alkaline phosphatase n=1 Tax=Novimethylophilus kurashikiensis TaxID=1825523 RepID=A0A2R5F7M5_9PROT|nr:hypothetical protein [Novimethylophilus kurashikiensis]GBG14242.1 alkaline phosphatase [Novimethylophilus kurashikiensis]
MHIVKQYESAVTLFAQGSGIWVYPSKAAALKELGFSWIARNVGPAFRVFSHVSSLWNPELDLYAHQPVYRTYEYVMRDDAGKPVTAADFQHLIIRRSKNSIWRFRARQLERWNGQGSVPNIGRHRGGHSYRAVQTTNERRHAFVLEDGDPGPRGSRNFKNLPNRYDDYCIAAREDRNWKRFRKTQWKQK